MDFLKQVITSVLIMGILLLVLSNTIGRQFLKINSKYEKMVGKKVIYKKDTLQVIDYSFMNATITLDDNTIMSFDFAVKLDTVK